VVMGCVSRPLNSFERQGRRPSALGHDGRGRWIFANRILADRILANRSGSRRRRLSARQIGSSGSAPRADERNVKNLASVPINRGSGAAAVVADKAVIAQVRKRLMAACGAPAAGRGAASRSQGFRGSPSFFVWRPVCLLRIKHARL
jgi:hypothetical protein